MNGIERMERRVLFHMVSVPVTGRIDVLNPKRSDGVLGKVSGQIPIQGSTQLDVHQMKIISKTPAPEGDFLSWSWSLLGQDLSAPVCFLLPPFSLIPYPLYGGKKTWIQAGLQPQCTPLAIQCRQLGCGMYISWWTWMQSVYGSSFLNHQKKRCKARIIYEEFKEMLASMLARAPAGGKYTACPRTLFCSFYLHAFPINVLEKSLKTYSFCPVFM